VSTFTSEQRRALSVRYAIVRNAGRRAAADANARTGTSGTQPAGEGGERHGA
jgi:hypothetical protein